MASGAVADFARGYVAGLDSTELAEVAVKLRRQGLDLSLSYLPAVPGTGSSLDQLATALDKLGAEAIGCELSIKPTEVGLGRGESVAAAKLTQLCAVAASSGASVTLEMEHFESYPATLRLWELVHDIEPSLGLTLPVDVHRAEVDVRTLAAAGARLRLCVGSYPLKRGVGYHFEQDKRLALVRCLRAAMEGGGYAMVASHDPTIIAIAQEVARRNGLGKESFEFQMYYGLRPLEQRRLVDTGYRSRCYLPFGPGWFDYLIGRVAARPRTVYSFLTAIRDKR